jgi:hypothetical protein
MVITADPQVEAEQDAGAEVAGGGGAAGAGAAGVEGVGGEDIEYIDDMPPPQALRIDSNMVAAAGKHRRVVVLAIVDCCARCMEVSLLRVVVLCVGTNLRPGSYPVNAAKVRNLAN